MLYDPWEVVDFISGSNLFPHRKGADLENDPKDDISSEEGTDIEDDDSDYEDEIGDYDGYYVNRMFDEIRSQHEENMSVISAHVQRSGIITAFSTILFIELFSIYQPGNLWVITLILFMACCVIGLISVCIGWGIPLGYDSREMFRLYNDGDYGNLFANMVIYKSKGLRISEQRCRWMMISTAIQMAVLILGMISLVYLEVGTIGVE